MEGGKTAAIREWGGRWGWKIFTGPIIAGSSQPERRQAGRKDQIRGGKELKLYIKKEEEKR